MMKIYFKRPVKLLITSCLFSVSLMMVSCSESPEPDDPKVEAPEEVIETPVEQINDLFAKIQGKWIYGERERSNGREIFDPKSKTKELDHLFSKNKGRIMDDYQGFIEFLSDTTYIFNDPKVLQPKWGLEYGKFQIDVENKKLILEGFGELTIQEINGEKVKFELKNTESNVSYSLEGEKRELLDNPEKTALLSRIWLLSDENDHGKNLLEELKEYGIDVYDENGQVIETYYPEGVIFWFTPSGTLISGHLLDDKIRPFDLANWKWFLNEKVDVWTTFDYNDWEDNLIDIIESRFLELTENRFVLREKWINDEGVVEEIIAIFNAYKK